MEQTALTTDLTDNLPPLLSSMLEGLKREGIYVGQESTQVKSSQLFEDKAIEAVNETVRQAFLLFREDRDIPNAARILEKIQVAAAMAEKAAYIVRNERARKCSQIAQRIADQCREYFHDLKAGYRPRKTA